METGLVMGNIDVAQITLYVFWVFFAGLLWYLRMEDRREGYPLESDVRGIYSKDPWLFVPRPKTFNLMHDLGTKSVPDMQREDKPIAAERVAMAPGSPLIPTGNPMTDGVGPGAWTDRLEVVDLTMDGQIRIAPMSVATEFEIVEGDPDPRGLDVVGADKEIAGRIVDVWIDKADSLIRYFEVEIGADDGKRTVMLPMAFCVFKTVRTGRKAVFVDAITSEQFADVPVPATPGQMTRREEDKIMAYYGAGMLYAMPERQEPLI